MDSLVSDYEWTAMRLMYWIFYADTAKPGVKLKGWVHFSGVFLSCHLLVINAVNLYKWYTRLYPQIR